MQKSVLTAYTLFDFF